MQPVPSERTQPEFVAGLGHVETLGQVVVEGGTETQRKIFYTALYRSFERMINISEDGQYYSAFDHKVHQDPRPFYVDNWLWDTFRALEPLILA